MGTLMFSVLDTSILIAESPSRIDGDIAISVVSIEPLPVDAAVAASYGELGAPPTRPGVRRPRGVWT